MLPLKAKYSQHEIKQAHPGASRHTSDRWPIARYTYKKPLKIRLAMIAKRNYNGIVNRQKETNNGNNSNWISRINSGIPGQSIYGEIP